MSSQFFSLAKFEASLSFSPLPTHLAFHGILMSYFRLKHIVVFFIYTSYLYLLLKNDFIICTLAIRRY